MDTKQTYISLDCCKTFDEKFIDQPSNVVLLRNSQDVNQTQIINLIENIKRTLTERYKIPHDDIYFIFRDIGITTKLLKNPIKIFKPYQTNLDFFNGALLTFNGVYNFTAQDNNIELSKYITLITGENYAGKSSIIDAIFTLFTGSGPTKSATSVKQGFIKCLTGSQSYIKNIKNGKECLISIDGKQQPPLTSKKFHEFLFNKFKYMHYLKKIYTFDITKNINKFITKTFFSEDNDNQPEKSPYEITSKQYETLTAYYESISTHIENPESKSIAKQEFDKFYVKEKEEEKIDDMFIKTLETFINKIINELNFSFYITIYEGKISVHNIHVNKTSISDPIKMSDASTMQQNLVSFIFKASLLKLWTISCTGDAQSRFPIYPIDELLDGFTLDSAILLNLIKRTERWFHRLIIVSNSPIIVSRIKSTFPCLHYEVVKPKLIKSLENSNNGSGSSIIPFGGNTAPLPKPSDLEEKFIQESFIPHALYKNIIVNTITDQFKCNKCGKIMQMSKLPKHLDGC